MKCKIIFILTLFLFSLSLHSQAVFAWDDKTTHPALTSECVNFYNLNSENQITDEEKQILIQGSIDEDTAPRWLNHFFDPIYNESWTGEFGPDNFFYEKIKQDPKLISPEEAVTTPDWATNQELQTKYTLYKENHTWQKAIYDYIKGDKQEAFYSLGYVLHLIQDMSVPEHTRNDTHIGDSPLENYCVENCTINTFKIANNLQKQGLKPYSLNSLNEYFEQLALYSNNYFFSKDTINIEKYSLPKIVKEEGGFAYGLDEDYFHFPLSVVETKRVKENDYYKIIKSYTLEEGKTYNSILKAYWQRLSREAILTCSGTLQLFFNEVKKFQQNPELLEEPPMSRTNLMTIGAKTLDNFGTIQFIKKTTNKITSWTSKTFSNLKNSASNLFVGTGGPALVSRTIPEEFKKTSLITEKLQFPPLEEKAPATPKTPIQTPQKTPIQKSAKPLVVLTNAPETTIVEPAIKPTQPTQPTQQTKPSPKNNAQPRPTVTQTITQDITPPGPSIITSPENHSTSTSSVIDFIGTAEANSIISQNLNNATTSTNQNGDWSIQLMLNQGANNIQFITTDNANNASNPTEINIFVDSIAPNVPVLQISECNDSMSTNVCLIATTTLNISWHSNTEDLNYFIIEQNGSIATTTATSTTITASNNSNYTFKVSAVDVYGNTSSSTTQTVEINTMPVVINEVAWAGTGQQTPSDEWIELYNPTSSKIDLSNLVLYSQTDQEPYINLTGEISAKGFYLIERTDDNTVASTTADLLTSFGNGLKNSGEILILSKASTTIDQTTLCGSGSTKWCPGFNYKYRTMERINPAISGTDSSNWTYNNNLIKNDKTAKGGDILGTPGTRNSANYLINKNQNLSADLTLTKENSPYVVDDIKLNVQAGATLTIEPGVVIKFYNDAGLRALGKIIAQGTEADPIVFTSFFDDDYAGDTNGDATSTTPAPKNWFGIKIDSSAEDDSTFNHTIFRYGGKYYTPYSSYTRALLATDGPNISVSNSIFEYSNYYGLALKNSTSTISNNIFKNNTDAGVASENDSSTLSNNTFLENKVGINLSNSPSTLTSNIFTSNANQAIKSFGTLGNFSNNNGSNNGTNAITIWGNLTTTNSTTNLIANSLPYYLDGYTIPTVIASSTLAIENGTVIKGIDRQLNVDGNLVISGNQPSDIIFTSLYDDTIGGDTNNDATSTQPTAGQFPGINISNTGSLVAKGFTMRYAGSVSYMGNNAAGIFINNSVAQISNAVFNTNYPYAIRAVNSENITIENARFENHNHNGTWGTKSAIKIENSTTTLTSVTFENNVLGILSDAISTFNASLIEWIGNTATTSPDNLF